MPNRLLAAGRLALAAAMLWLAGCATQQAQPERRPATEVQSQIVLLMPTGVPDASGWARDIQVAFDRLGLEADKSHLCAALAVIAQESGFKADPRVPGLAGIARQEILRRAKEHHIPEFVVDAALRIKSSDGRSYGARIAAVRSERELSEIFEDLIGRVPLGKRLFGDANPVHTGGPMQVSIAWSEAWADTHDYPWPHDSIRHEVFSRRGGLYFGIAHLLAYPVSYNYMRYRFADFNAGLYASRNAAFQNAVRLLSGRKLALDGDLISYTGNKAGATESAVLSLRQKLDLDAGTIHDSLELGENADFEQSLLYQRIYALADAKKGSALPRAMLPRIRLESPKISRNLTTAWFARRVDTRYRSCLRK